MEHVELVKSRGPGVGGGKRNRRWNTRTGGGLGTSSDGHRHGEHGTASRGGRNKHAGSRDGMPVMGLTRGDTASPN